MDHIGWSPDGKRSAVVWTEPTTNPMLLFLDGKQQPEYHQLFSRGDNTYGSSVLSFYR